MSTDSSRASAALSSASNEPDSISQECAKSTPSASECSEIISRGSPSIKMFEVSHLEPTSSPGASPVKIYQSQEAKPDLRAHVALCGRSTSAVSAKADPDGSSLKMSDTPGGVGCPLCEPTWDNLDTQACRFECEPLTWERATRDLESLSLPTPTASSYGSCRGGGSGRVGKWRKSLLGRGIRNPEDWERMMGFPVGWTAVEPLETR
jgi:hypothetical protein